MDQPRQLTLSGSRIAVHAALDESALALTAEEFFERYVRPAFTQLQREEAFALAAESEPINHNFKEGTFK